jgi:hypothetical protein
MIDRWELQLITQVQAVDQGAMMGIGVADFVENHGDPGIEPDPPFLHFLAE